MLAYWRQRNQPPPAVIDADALAHDCLEPGTTSYTAVIDHFGDAILTQDQSIDRAKLGEMVFGDDTLRQQLNAIIHPLVRRRWRGDRDRLYRLCLDHGRPTECFLDHGDEQAGEGCQLIRLRENGFSETAARARMAAQWPIQQKLDRADYVIWNDGHRSLMEAQADRIWMRLQEDSHALSKN